MITSMFWEDESGQRVNETGDQGHNPATAVVRSRWGQCGGNGRDETVWGAFCKPFHNDGIAV